MSFPDLSLYITKENIIFLVILGLVVLITAVIVFFVIRGVVRFVVSIFKNIFSKKNPKIDQGGDLGVTVEELEVSREERTKLAELEKEKTIKASPKLDYNNFPKKEEAKDTEKTSKQIYEEKEKAGVEEGLSRLKSTNPNEDNSTDSKMALRSENQEDDKFKEIEIPVPKRFSTEEVNLKENQEGLNNFEKTTITTDHGALQSSGNYSQIKAGGEPNHLGYGPVQKEHKVGQGVPVSVSEKEATQTKGNGIMGAIGKMFVAKDAKAGNKLSNSSVIKDAKAGNKLSNSSVIKDASIFGGSGEINRRIMGYKLKLGRGDLAQKIYKAQKASGIKLSSTERENLVTKYFPKFYGQNISEKEFAKQVKLLERKQVMDPVKRLQTKREINFLKKIGGIK